MFNVKNLFVAAAAFGLVACSSAPPANSAVTGGPAWTNRGGGAFDAPHGQGFYAVGIGTSKNKSMRRKQSDNRARVEIAKIFNTEVTNLFKDYMASTSDVEKENYEENSEEVSQIFTDVKLAGIQVVDHWVDADGTEYALAYLNLDAIGDTIDKVEKLSKRAAAAIKARAGAAHDALDQRRKE
ncbi:MAG: LPP20 family lipoprotein [Myxococcota bacterium]|nr:LPP20 family lipoprotein [Myxococcota bacterium]